MNFSGNNSRVEDILARVGLTGLEQLFVQIPDRLRYPDINLESGIDEQALRNYFLELAERNAPALMEHSFLGGGFYRHYIPAVVDYVSSLGSFATAYTPYQAEVSQGTLQSLFEYQTYIGELTGMETVNASHYDGATASAEAFRMLYESNKKRGPGILVLSVPNPEYREIWESYLQFTDAKLHFKDIFTLEGGIEALEIPDDCGTVSVSLPDYYGRVADIRGLGEKCRERGVHLHIHGDPLLFSVIAPPGSLLADVYTGEGQVLGIPVNMGGPYLGLFAVSGNMLRRMPGRIAGETQDSSGRRGFVLALSTREQHIRREKASSNICTNQGLMALRAVVHMAAMGRDGLCTVARRCISNAEYLMTGLAQIPGCSVEDRDVLHFREFVLKCDFPVEMLLKLGKERGIHPGIALGDGRLLVCTTEVHEIETLDALIALVREGAGK